MNIKGVGPEYNSREVRSIKAPITDPPRKSKSESTLPLDKVEVKQGAMAPKISPAVARAMDKLSHDKGASLTRLERQAIANASVADYMLFWYDQAGVFTYAHELGHAAAAKTLFAADKVTVQVDGVDNLKNFLAHPGKDTWQRLMDGHDANQDGAAGVTTFEGLYYTPFTKVLGLEGGLTMVALAGQATLEIPQLAGFAAGFKLRKENPVVGYTMMSAAAVNHFVNTVYPLSAAFIPADKMSQAAESGHDFAQVAVHTGIHPLVTAGVFAALLPLEAAGLMLLEKHQEGHIKDQMALSQLIQKGQVSAKEIEDLQSRYPGREELDEKAAAVQSLMDTKMKNVKAELPNEIKRATLEFQKEYQKFGEFMADELRERVDAAKKDLPEPKKLSLGESIHKYVDGLKETYRKDHLEAVLDVGSKVGTGAAIAYGGAKVLNSARLIGLSYGTAVEASLGGTLLGTAVSALKTVMPGVGAVMAANSIYQGYKTVANPAIPAKEKAFAVSLAAFSALGAAAFIVPTVAPLLAIGGIVGTVGTLGAKFLSDKLAHHSHKSAPA